MKHQLVRHDILSLIAGCIITSAAVGCLLASATSFAGEVAMLSGSYRAVSSDRYDDYLKALGVSFMTRRVLSSTMPVLTISVADDDWSIRTETISKTVDVTFEPGQTVDEATIEGRQVKAIFTFENNKLVEVQRAASGEDSTITRVFSGSGMTEELTVGPVVSTRYYTKE